VLCKLKRFWLEVRYPQKAATHITGITITIEKYWT